MTDFDVYPGADRGRWRQGLLDEAARDRLVAQVAQADRAPLCRRLAGALAAFARRLAWAMDGRRRLTPRVGAGSRALPLDPSRATWSRP
jgi:hypothetical protein